MRILADENVPEEYVFALRGDGHEIAYSRDIQELGPSSPDDDLVAYAEENGYAILSTDVKDFSDRSATIPVLVAPQQMTGGDVQAAVSRLEALPFDPGETEPLWLTGL